VEGQEDALLVHPFEVEVHRSHQYQALVDGELQKQGEEQLLLPSVAVGVEGRQKRQGMVEGTLLLPLPFEEVYAAFDRAA
jgi:hypothetical protein